MGLRRMIQCLFEYHKEVCNVWSSESAWCSSLPELPTSQIDTSLSASARTEIYGPMQYTTLGDCPAPDTVTDISLLPLLYSGFGYFYDFVNGAVENLDTVPDSDPKNEVGLLLDAMCKLQYEQDRDVAQARDRSGPAPDFSRSVRIPYTFQQFRQLRFLLSPSSTHPSFMNMEKAGRRRKWIVLFDKFMLTPVALASSTGTPRLPN